MASQKHHNYSYILGGRDDKHPTDNSVGRGIVLVSSVTNHLSTITKQFYTSTMLVARQLTQDTYVPSNIIVMSVTIDTILLMILAILKKAMAMVESTFRPTTSVVSFTSITT